ncbi:MAG: hypothetical protein GY820_02725 [Gammaproteobacteria bacterium]|nr:hypothetical protein [Gammaproteobacteria bacterium]
MVLSAVFQFAGMDHFAAAGSTRGTERRKPFARLLLLTNCLQRMHLLHLCMHCVIFFAASYHYHHLGQS